MELRDFREDFIENIKVDAYSSGEGSQAAFVSAMADCLVDAEVLPDFNPAYYDQIGRRNRRLRVDGYVLDEVDFTMNLIIADYLGEKSDPRKFGKADLTQAVNRVMHFVEACLDDTLEVDISTPPSDLRDDIQHYRTDIRNYRILIFTDAERRSTLKAIEAFDIDGKHTECQIWDIDRVFRVCGSNSGRQEIEIDFTQYTAKGIPCLRASDAISKEYEGFLCIIPGVVLANIYDRYGSALLEGNVRSFLSTKVAVNKKIRGTILNNPERFFAYNNGVSATALELTFDATGNFITGAKDFQIINGGQTTASLSNARFKDKAPLDNIYVQMKLTKIGAMDEESATDLIRNISRSSNSQNKVSDADFFSTHPFHVEMEKFSQRIFAPAVEGQQYETHWFYERARGQYLQAQMRMTKGEQKRFKMQNPKSQVITKTDLAKVRNSWAKMPQLVSKGAQTNFVKYAESIDSAWTDNSAQFNEKYFTDSVALLIIFKRLEKIIPEQPWYQSGYRANIVTYSMAVLHLLIERQFPGRELDLQIIWNRQSVPEVIENALIPITYEVYRVITDPNRPTENVTQWCKREACWQHAQQIDITLPKEMVNVMLDHESAMAVKRAARKNQRIENGMEAQKKVLSYNKEYWAALAAFAVERHLVAPSDIAALKIAVQIPDKLPNAVQAKKLLALIKKATEDGFKYITERQE